MAENFASLPIIDFNDALSPTTKPNFLSELRHALVKVGFFYLKNHTIPSQVQQDLLRTSETFFSLPADRKAEVNMANSKSFRGFTGLGNERTATKADERETFFVCDNSPHTGNLGNLLTWIYTFSRWDYTRFWIAPVFLFGIISWDQTR